MSTRLVNASGNRVAHTDLYPFGFEMSKRSADPALDGPGRMQEASSVDGRYKFTGKERDSETSYDYFGARYYDARIGRWLQVDPLGENYPSQSPYNFVLNNPLRFVDVFGMQPTTEEDKDKDRERRLKKLDDFFEKSVQISTRVNIPIHVKDKKIKKEEKKLELPIYNSDIITKPTEIQAFLGQKVELEFQNMNILGTTIRVIPIYPSGFTSQEIILLPNQEHTFVFTDFGNEPLFWKFRITTVSDAFIVKYQIRSTWVPGMLHNPPLPDSSLIFGRDKK